MGVAGEKGDLGRAEMLKTETLNAPLDARIWWDLEILRQVSFGASVFLQTALPRFFSAAVLSNPTGGSGGFENQSAAVIQMSRCMTKCLESVLASSRFWCF